MEYLLASPLLKPTLRFGIGLFAIYILLMTTMYALQRSLQYHPNGREFSPSELGLVAFERKHLETPDGERLLAWYKPAPIGKPTILFLHGNGGGLSSRTQRFSYYAAQNFGVLALSYRGYEGSSGSVSEAGLVTDAVTAYQWLKAQGVSESKIALVGESLGTGVAVQLAAAQPVFAIALEAPYANAVDLASAAYWYFPVRWLMKDQFQSSQFIARVSAPILIQHGTQDTLIPVTQGRRLFELANEPKQFIAVDGAGHEMINELATWKLEIEFFNALPQSGN